MDTVGQAEDFSRFVANLPVSERQSHIDVLYERWRESALADEDFESVAESLRDYRAGERGEEHGAAMARIRDELDREFGS